MSANVVVSTNVFRVQRVWAALDRFRIHAVGRNRGSLGTTLAFSGSYRSVTERKSVSGKATTRRFRGKIGPPYGCERRFRPPGAMAESRPVQEYSRKQSRG